MIERLIDSSIRRRWLVLVAVLAVAALGLWNYGRLPTDAVPDATDVQVQINTARRGFTQHRAWRDLHVVSRSEGGREERTGTALHQHGSAHGSGMDHQTATAQCPGRNRNQFDRWLRKAVRCHAATRAARQLWIEFSRRDG